MGRRLLAGVACQLASARSSCKAGSGPPALHSPRGGNSSRDAAKARCAATARMPLHLTTHAALCRRPERGRHFCCTRAGQQANESCCFRGPTAAYLEPEHNQAAAACPLELRVGLALFAAGGLGNYDAGMGICVGPGLAIPTERTYERGINCELFPMPQGQPVADNLDAPGVLHGHVQVHISQAHIPGHTCASLAAHPGECALHLSHVANSHISQATTAWHTWPTKAILFKMSRAVFTAPSVLNKMWNDRHLPPRLRWCQLLRAKVCAGH